MKDITQCDKLAIQNSMRTTNVFSLSRFVLIASRGPFVLSFSALTPIPRFTAYDNRALHSHSTASRWIIASSSVKCSPSPPNPGYWMSLLKRYSCSGSEDVSFSINVRVGWIGRFMFLWCDVFSYRRPKCSLNAKYSIALTNRLAKSSWFLWTTP